MALRPGSFASVTMFLIAVTPCIALAGQIYVDVNASGSNSGTSWSNAYTSLQDALAAASAGTQIWVAEGVYRPDRGRTVKARDRTATFRLKNGVAIYGGFPSGGGAWEDRNPNVYQTTLGGDLNADDGPNFANNSENSYHVVTGSGTNKTAILDGFTVTGGNGTRSFPHNCGSGMINLSGSPALANCKFIANLSTYLGAGMYNSGSNPTVINCTFSGNLADTSEGGGMYNDASSPTLKNCTFSNNASVSFGGGMCNYHSNPTLSYCTFSHNSAARDGGGMHNLASSPKLTDCTFVRNRSTNWSGGGIRNRDRCNPTLTNCTFSGNFANNNGGGMDSQDNCHPTLTNCTFSVNIAARGGGGMCNSANCNPKVTNCNFIGNVANDSDGGGMNNVGSSPTVVSCTFVGNASTSWSGGGMCNHNGSPVVINCIFSGNSANHGGGGMHISHSDATVTNCIFSGNSAGEGGGMRIGDCNPNITNCTFSGNSASDGGGMENSNCNSNITNCIFWGNDAVNDGDEIHKSSSNPVFRYCDIKGGTAGGTGNIAADPMFRDADGLDNIVGTADDDLRLRCASACIDAGDNTAVPADIVDLDRDGDTSERTPLDLDNSKRFWDAPYTPDRGVPDAPRYPNVVDMGPYEFMVLADFEPDGDVDLVDFAFFAVHWMDDNCAASNNCEGMDLDRSGTVNTNDLLIFTRNWLTGRM